MNLIDFALIRTHSGSQHGGFEQLIHALALRSKPTGAFEYVPIDGSRGDGGREGYWRTARGEVAIQAKWWTDPTRVNFAQIDASVKKALDSSTRLSRYIVAIACDLTHNRGPGDRTKSGRDKWEEYCKRWNTYCKTKRHRDVKFEIWTATHLRELLAPHHDLVATYFEPTRQASVASRQGYAATVGQLRSRYLGTAASPRSFAGRELEQTELLTWLASDAEPQFRMIVGLAGVGKSSFLAHCAAEIEACGEWRVLYVPISFMHETSREHVILTILADGLRSVVFPGGGAGADLGAGLSRSSVIELVQQVPPSERVLIVIDALDETSEPFSGADLFPTSLPRNIRIVVSARGSSDDPSVTEIADRFGWHSEGAVEVVELRNLKHDGIIQLLISSGVGAEMEPVEALPIADELYRLTGGDPLQLQLQLGELKGYCESGSILSSLKRQTAGLSAYLDNYMRRLWREQLGLWSKSDARPLEELEVRHFLSVLSCALGPLTVDDVSAVFPEGVSIDTWLIEPMRQKLSRLLVGDGRARPFTFQHPRLSEWFYREHLSAVERDAWEKRFDSWFCSAFERAKSGAIVPTAFPTYIVQCRVAHLRRAGASIQKFDFVFDRTWVEVSQCADPTLSHYASDVEEVLRAAVTDSQRALVMRQKLTALPTEIGCLLVKCTLNVQLAGLTATLLLALTDAQFWSADHGASIASTLSQPLEQARALFELSLLFPEDRAVSLLLKALSVATNCEEHELEDACRVIVGIGKRLQERGIAAPVGARALKAAERIERPSARVLTLRWLCDYVEEDDTPLVLKEVSDALIGYDAAQEPRLFLASAEIRSRLLGTPMERELAAIDSAPAGLRRLALLSEFRGAMSPTDLRRRVAADLETACRELREGPRYVEGLDLILEALGDADRQALLQNILQMAEPSLQLLRFVSPDNIGKGVVQNRQDGVWLNATTDFIENAQVRYALSLPDYDRLTGILDTIDGASAREKDVLLAAIFDGTSRLHGRLTAEQFRVAARQLDVAQYRDLLSKMLQNVRRCDDSDAIENAIADIGQYKTTESDPYVEPASMLVVDERLAAIFTIADPTNRGQELVNLALSLPSSHRSKVMQGLATAVDSIKAPTLKAPLLRSLIDLLEHPERQQRFSEAIELAQAIPEPEERAQHLLGLVPFVRESQKQLLLEMTEEARSGYDVAMAFESAQTIAAPFDKARALLDLVSRLPEKEANLARKQIWDVVNGEGPSKRALLLMPFMGVLKEGELQAAFAAAYKLSQELEDPELRIQLLDSLANFANASDAIMLKGIADSIRKPGEGARALAEIGLAKEMEDRARRLIELIPVLTGEDRNTAFDWFREASRSILDGTMAVLWPSLVRILHVSERQVLFDQALRAARTMDDPAYRAMIYAGLSDIGGTSHQQNLRKEAEKEVARSRAYSVVDELLVPRLTRLAEYGLEDQAAEVALGHAEAFDRALLLAEIGRCASRARRKRIISLAYDAALEVEELERRIWLLFNIVTQMEAEEAQSGIEVALDLVSQVDNPIVAAAMTVGLTRNADPERRRRACQPHLRLVWRAEDLLQWPSLFRTPRLYLEDESHIKAVVMPMLADVGLLNPIFMTTGRGRASVLGKLHRAVGWLPPPETYAIWEEIRADVSSEPRRTLLDVLRLEWGLIQSLAPAGVAAQAISAIRRTSDQWP